jgi:hypothetical protein
MVHFRRLSLVKITEMGNKSHIHFCCELLGLTFDGSEIHMSYCFLHSRIFSENDDDVDPDPSPDSDCYVNSQPLLIGRISDSVRTVGTCSQRSFGLAKGHFLCFGVNPIVAEQSEVRELGTCPT